MPRGGVPVGAEDDEIGVLALGECAQAIAGGAAEDDVAADLGVTEPLRAALEQLVGVVLRYLLGGGVGLLGVADIGERHARAGVAEDLPERQCVVVVVGAIVGDDHMGLHGVPCLKRVVARPANRVRAERYVLSFYESACHSPAISTSNVCDMTH